MKLLMAIAIGFISVQVCADSSTVPPHFLVMDQDKVVTGESCTLGTVSSQQWVIVNREVSRDGLKIPMGSLVQLSTGSAEFLRYPSLNTPRTPLVDSVKINISQIEPLGLWTLNIQKGVQTTIDDKPFDFTNKQLRVVKRNNKYVIARCCFRDAECKSLPLFHVLEQGRPLFQLAATPMLSFANQYQAIRRQVVTKPKTQKQEIVGSDRRQSSGVAGGVSPPSINDSAPNVPPRIQRRATPRNAIADSAPINNNIPVPSPLKTQRFPQESNAVHHRVVCTKRQNLILHNMELNQIAYRIPRFQQVRVFQNFEGSNDERYLKGYRLVRVQVTTAQGKNINGWAADQFIVPASSCPQMGLVYSPNGEDIIHGAPNVVDSPTTCCRFPTLRKPDLGYESGEGFRYFGARRKGKDKEGNVRYRAHAAADLLRPVGEKVIAVDEGVVLAKYRFLHNTYALEVKHGPRIMRYCEVNSRTAPGVVIGTQIVRGQHIGWVGDKKMLHFEMYTGSATGPLTQRTNGEFWRRDDLMDPTQDLKAWEVATFNMGRLP